MAKQEREKTLNSLEAFIFETQVSTQNHSPAGRFQYFSILMCLYPSLVLVQDKIYQDEYLLVVSEEEKEQISSKLKEASEWMDEDGYSATTKQLREKLSQLKSLCKDMFFRVEERRKWPDHLAALDSMLNTSAFFLRWVCRLNQRWLSVLRGGSLLLVIHFAVVASAGAPS